MTVRLSLVPLLRIALFISLPVLSLHAHSASAAAKQADVRVVIDISGSMKQNDPQTLRKPALELLVKLFPDNAKAGVWTFAEATRVLVPHRQVNDSWRKTALAGAARITSTGLYTNIPQALQEASRSITDTPTDTDHHIILLTDGMVDIDKDPTVNAAARKTLIDEILPALRKRQIKVHTIALSANADKVLMEKIAIDTGGLSAQAETADELAKIFVQALDVAAPREQVPLKDNRFVIDKTIDEFTMLVFRQNSAEQTALLAPDGKRYDAESKAADVAWFRNEGYDLVTVRKPVAGDWKIEAALQPGSRVTIVSNLSLKSSRFPSSFFVGADERLSATLSENDKPIVQEDFLKLIEMSAVVKRRDDNQFWQQPLAFDAAALQDAAAADAPFTTTLQMLGETGTYDIVVKADGKTFQRELRQTVSVYDAFEVVINVGKDIPPQHTVTLIPRNPDIVPADSRVISHVTNPDGSEALPLAVLQPNETWQLQLSDEKNAGEFRIWFEIEAKDRQGNSKLYKTPSRTIIHLLPGALTAVEPVEKKSAPPVVEPAPAPAPPAATEESSLSQILMIAAVALGNILVLALGYFTYRTLMSSTKKNVLEESDEDVDDDAALADIIAEEEAALKASGDVLPKVVPVAMAAAAVVPEIAAHPDEMLPDIAEPADELMDSILIPDDDLPAEALENPPFGEAEDLLPKDDGDDFALPDDAIDIDPDAEDEKT